MEIYSRTSVPPLAIDGSRKSLFLYRLVYYYIGQQVRLGQQDCNSISEALDKKRPEVFILSRFCSNSKKENHQGMKTKQAEYGSAVIVDLLKA